MFKHLWIGLLLVTCAMSLSAEEKYDFASEQQRLDFVQLNQELRCPKCQNQNIADSNALIATDMKRKVYELVKEGHSKDEVVDFMKVRYGDFVHYKPPMTVLTLWLYLGPVLFILLAVSFFFYSNRSRKSELIENSGDSTKQAEDTSSKIQKAEQALKELE